MPRKVSKAKTKAKNKKISRQPMSWFKKILVYGLIFFCFMLFIYVGYLDYTTRKQFAGKRWSLPAKVYASSTEIYSGYSLTAKKFEDLLLQLHYQKNAQLSTEGSYFKKGQQIDIKTRNFNFRDKKQRSKRLRISFSADSVTKILNLTTAKEVPIIRMEPIQIGSFYPTRKEDRVLIKLENTPDALIQGLMTIEDRDFYHHFGLSFKAIARAFWANIRAGHIVQGGSTITQQLVKNFYLTPERSLWRKINEALMALILEYHFQKDEILEAYLNEIYLGQDGASSVHGFGLASQFYFGQSLSNLPLHDIATLIALVRGPSYYNPRKNPNRSIQRRNLVLAEMQKEGYITKTQTRVAQQQKLHITSRSHQPVNHYPSFLDLVKKQLRQTYREDRLTSDGLKIFTTLDIQIQNKLEQTIVKKLKQLEKKPNTNQLETAAIVTGREGGEIVALAGGRNRKAVGFNRALNAVRPIGSLIKPAIYLTALSYPEKYTLTTKVSDTAMEIKGKNQKRWQPKNYDNKEHGTVELQTALTYSYNLATVQIGMDIGIAKIAQTIKNLGGNRPIQLFPSLLLGATAFSPLEVIQMYQTLAGDGFATPLRSIRAVMTIDGKVLQSYSYRVRQTVDPAATYLTNKILQAVMDKGTGRSAYRYLPKSLALVGKTGTTNQLRDSWFAGYSGDYLSVVWIGRDDNKPTGLTGASGALQLWATLMKQISTQAVSLVPPDNVAMYWIDPVNGLLANQECAGALLYPYIKGSAPEATSPCVTSILNRPINWWNDFKDSF